MDKKQMYHIGGEVVALAGVMLYINKVNKDLTKKNEELTKRIGEIENVLKIFNDNFAQLVDTVDSHHTVLSGRPPTVGGSNVGGLQGPPNVGISLPPSNAVPPVQTKKSQPPPSSEPQMECKDGVCKIPSASKEDDACPFTGKTGSLPSSHTKVQDEHFTNLDELDAELADEINKLGTSSTVDVDFSEEPKVEVLDDAEDAESDESQP